MDGRVNSDISKLLTQTRFLLEKQSESKDYCCKKFAEFLALIDRESEKASSEDLETVKKLKLISEVIEQHLAEFEGDVDKDILFLEDQIKAIEAIGAHEDSSAAEKLIKILMDGQEIPDMDKFKKEVEEESEISKKSFADVLDDFKSALLDGGIDELLAYLNEFDETSEDDGYDMEFDLKDESYKDESYQDKSSFESSAGGDIIDEVLKKSESRCCKDKSCKDKSCKGEPCKDECCKDQSSDGKCCKDKSCKDKSCKDKSCKDQSCDDGADKCCCDEESCDG